MTSSLDDFLATATRAARHPGAALEARAYLAVTVRMLRAVLAECDEAWTGGVTVKQIRDAMTNARRNR